ncbi:hypothetical protein [Sphingomonas sp. EC-HK361]|uniref:hypothetical protein n=1 Tax=Sphingomonas sp. EC-HK361 TaxID=2038397 RepID=UPI00125EAA10|nr:hypothetical protein [Sphingomonas sp. EC-HK361]
MADPNTVEHPDSERDDDRSDLEQIVEARSDAVKRGEGGEEPATLKDPGMPDGVGGTGGVTRNQDDDAQ